MKGEQKVVAVGAASGVILMVLGVMGLLQVLPTANVADTIGDRLAYALLVNVFAIVPFFVMLIKIGNSRFFSAAIDPTRHADSKHLEIDGRVAENTFQQNFVFFVVTLTLSTIVPLQYLHVVAAVACVFVVARCAFWIGYRIDPLYRAPGMSATAYMNLFAIVYILYQTLTT